MRVLRLVNGLSPGDILVMTAAVYSLHKAHPGKFLTGVQTPCPHLWENNPDVATDEQLEGVAEDVQMHYPLIHECNQLPVHMIEGYPRFLAHALQVPVPLAINRPMLYVSEEEKNWLPQVDEITGRKTKYWILNGGVKTDYRAKAYPYWQEVVNLLLGKILFVQIGSAEHLHKPLRGVIDLIGRTDLRQLVRMAHHAQGVLCGVTLAMHLAAALEKPAVIVAGAREPRSWNTYPGQILLNNVGTLPCCRTQACWKSRVVRAGDGSEQDQSLCESPVLTDPPTGRCMSLISPQTVADAVESFYTGGVLSY